MERARSTGVTMRLDPTIDFAKAKGRQILFAVATAIWLALMPNVFAQDFAPGTTAAPPDWKIVSLGTFANTYDLMAALDDAKVRVGDLANEAMHRPGFTIAKSRFEVAAVVVSAAELGVGEKGASQSDVLERGRRLGLELCPPELAAQLRLQYLDQPVGELLHLAMEPIRSYSGQRVSLAVGNGGAGLILIGSLAAEDVIVPQQHKFVFARPLRVAQPITR